MKGVRLENYLFSGRVVQTSHLELDSQRQAIKLAAEAGVRARTSAAGSETLPLTHHHLCYAMLSRNGELTKAGQHDHQLLGRPPPSRQYDRNQPLIREGPNDQIMLRGGAKKLLHTT